MYAGMEPTPYIWMNGELVAWEDATVHVGSHGLHYGSGVFEGIRCYETARGPAVFRLTDHMKRLETSASLIHMQLPYTVDELVRATLELLSANGLPACYVRPIAFYGYGTLGVPPRQNPVEVVVMSWPWGTYLGSEALDKGIRVKVSSWRRVGPNTIPHAAKATGVYLNSMLAVMEANRAGYDEALLLTEDGYVGDGSGENIFAVKGGVISTPDLSASILPGITRDAVFTIARDLGHDIREKPLIRTDLYTADELFMTGTAAEVTPLRAVDDIEIGDPGPVTRSIQETFLAAVTGKVERYEGWLELVPKSSAVPAS
jgi:branched-chain amino acid aminotransferase